MKKVKIGKGMVVSKEKAAKNRKKPGASNLGKYPNVEKKDFAGSTPGTFPINSKKRAESALKLAHNDSNPNRVKAKVFKKYPGLKPKGTRGKK